MTEFERMDKINVDSPFIAGPYSNGFQKQWELEGDVNVMYAIKLGKILERKADMFTPVTPSQADGSPTTTRRSSRTIKPTSLKYNEAPGSGGSEGDQLQPCAELEAAKEKVQALMRQLDRQRREPKPSTPDKMESSLQARKDALDAAIRKAKAAEEAYLAAAARFGSNNPNNPNNTNNPTTSLNNNNVGR